MCPLHTPGQGSWEETHTKFFSSQEHKPFNYKRENQSTVIWGSVTDPYSMERDAWCLKKNKNPCHDCLRVGPCGKQTPHSPKGQEKKVNRRSCCVARFLQHGRDSSSQKWEAANNRLDISVSFLVNRNGLNNPKGGSELIDHKKSWVTTIRIVDFRTGMGLFGWMLSGTKV